MTDDIVARLRAYEGRAWETTACYNGLREEAADVLEQERGDARTLRGFIATYKMTPSMMASRAESAEARVRELEAWRDKAIVVLKWTDEVYPARIEAGGAGVEITWDEFNAMREVAGFKPVKRINDKEGRAGFNHRLRARLSTIEAETIERCAQAVHGAVQMIPMGQVDASEFLDVIEDAIAAAIRKLAQEVKS